MSAEQPTGSLRFKVDLPALFKEIVQSTELRQSPGAVMGLELIKLSLHRVAQRAIELNDAVILEELEVIGVVHVTEVSVSSEEAGDGSTRAAAAAG